MAELRDRFRSIDRIPAPDLWAEVTRRAQAPSGVGPVRMGPALGGRTNAGHARRTRVARLGWALALTGLLLALVLGALLAGALRPRPQTDLSTGPFGPTGLLRGSDSTSSVAVLPDGRALLVTATWERFNPVPAAQLWSPDAGLAETGRTLAPRLNPTVTLLLDGRVLVVGGMGGPLAYPDTAVATAELWDPATGQFTATGSMTHPRVGHTATLLTDGRVLVAGGAWPRSEAATAEVWDPATGLFTSAGTMGLGASNRGLERSNHSAVLLADGRVLVAGGIGADGAGRGRSETWDPATSRFDGAGHFVDEPAEVDLTRLLDGRVLQIVHLPGAGMTLNTWDPVTGATTSAQIDGRRAPQRGVLLGDGRVAIFGGSSLGANVTAVTVWDPVREDVDPAVDLQGPAEGRSFTLLPDGRILVTKASGGPDEPGARVYELETRR